MGLTSVKNGLTLVPINEILLCSKSLMNLMKNNKKLQKLQLIKELKNKELKQLKEKLTSIYYRMNNRRLKKDRSRLQYKKRRTALC